MNQHRHEAFAAPSSDHWVEIVTGDRVHLKGRLHLPDGPIRQAIVLHGATGVPARYYQAFARWLSDREGAAVLLYDYRDFGWSQQGRIEASRASISDWALHDQEAALLFMLDRFSDVPVEVIGHSLGALGLARHARAGEVSRLTAVASGPAYWLDHPLSYLPKVLMFWWLLGPAAVAAVGYLPGRRLGFGADLPAEVYWEWRRWCLSRGFNDQQWQALSHADTAPDALRCPVTMVAIEDDVVISPSMVQRLARSYPQAETSFRLVSPTALGLGPIGHIGVFHESNATAWPLLRPESGTRPELF
jgi:predicted alpha/beta hydrolase